MDNLTMAQKQERKAMFCQLIEAENMGIHKYVDAIKVAPEHKKMLQAIMNEEFQHIHLLNELIKDLGEVPDMIMMEHENHSSEEHHESVEKSEVETSSEIINEMTKSQPMTVSFKRSK